MSQDAFIHEALRANINTPKGENATIFADDNVARNPDDPTARFVVKHADGTFEPIAVPGPGAAPYYFSVAIVGVENGLGTEVTLTATPSVGIVGAYTYAWTKQSNVGMVNDEPILGVPVGNVISITKTVSAFYSYGLIKCTTTHIVTGAISESFFWVGLEGNPV